MKFATKTEFIQATQQQWELLWDCIDQVGSSAKSQKSIKQILGHLYAWHRLLLGWCKEGEHGKPDLPATGFKWSETRLLNAKIDSQNSVLEYRSIVRRLKLSHHAVLKIVDGLSEKQLLESGHFHWTGKNALSSYIVPNTFSHYRWAIKKIKKLDS